jgi:hypothetical protein
MLNSLGLIKAKINRQNSRQSIKSNDTSEYTSLFESCTEKSDSSSSTLTTVNRVKSVTFADQLENICETVEEEKIKDLSLKKQSNYSKYLKNFKSAKQIWKHEPEILIEKGCNYSAKV